MKGIVPLLLAIALALLASLLLAGSVVVARAETRLGQPLVPSGDDTQDGQAACPIPEGWLAYQLQQGDTLQSLADRHGVPVTDLAAANCHLQHALPGEFVYLPSYSAAEDKKPCGPPSGWVLYQPSPGEGFAELSSQFAVAQDLLREANCLGPLDSLPPGARLFVPPPPAR